MESSKLLILKQKQPKRLAKQLPHGTRPVSIDWKTGGVPAIIEFSDGASSLGSCIRCTNPPCMEYSAQELELEAFKDFPADKNSSVCPTGAITWLLDDDAPTIDRKACISCGLCVSRCPVRAIHLSQDGAYLNDEPNDHFQLQSFLATKESTESVAEEFVEVEEKGIYYAESENVLSEFLINFAGVTSSQSTQFPNHLARNLLIACGIGASMRRKGDTNVRMDMVLGAPGVNAGTSEVEFEDVLSAPRNILDNMAVLVARYEIKKNEIVPLIVSLSLPSLRSDYWIVIKDIRKVLGIKINSITIGALIVLVWNRAKIVISTGDELYIDTDQTSLRPLIESILARSINTIREYPGFLDSEK